MNDRFRSRSLSALSALLVGISSAGCGGSAASPVVAPPNTAAVPSLIQSLKSRKPAARARAAVSISRIGPAAEEAVPALVAALKDHDPAVKAAAAHALGKIGPAAKSALPELTALAKHAALREVAEASIKEIDK